MILGSVWKIDEFVAAFVVIVVIIAFIAMLVDIAFFPTE